MAFLGGDGSQFSNANCICTYWAGPSATVKHTGTHLSFIDHSIFGEQCLNISQCPINHSVFVCMVDCVMDFGGYD